MLKNTVCGLLLGATLASQANAAEKLTLVLDWYINPDHAPIMVAEQIGAFKAEGLDVKIVPLPTRRCRRAWWRQNRPIWPSPTSRSCTFCRSGPAAGARRHPD